MVEELAKLSSLLTNQLQNAFAAPTHHECKSLAKEPKDAHKLEGIILKFLRSICVVIIKFISNAGKVSLATPPPHSTRAALVEGCG